MWHENIFQGIKKFYLSKISWVVPAICRKACFQKNRANSQSLSPLGHLDGFASCKAWCVLVSASLPKTPSPRWKAVYAWLALRLAKPLGIHARHPCRGWMWGCRPHPAWGYAPNPIFDKSNFHNILNNLNHKLQGETENGWQDKNNIPFFGTGFTV